ncbi:hypothetical protein DL765_000038 [Monosporascus sp. GIB2]|nr:hypothetical protein DL765_000038 [Monosporascus sp. GIB2]
MASQERITVHNLAGKFSPPSPSPVSVTHLKNTSDDAIPNYLNSLKFRQDHRLVDTRLALGYGAFAVAGACFLWDYKFGFEATKWLTAGAVALYSLLNGLLTYWIAYVEAGTVYQGTAPDGSKISIATFTKKNVPVYDVKITLTPPASKEKGNGAKEEKKTIELARSFTEWFDVQGHFIAPPFQTMLATSVPVIGKADPKRAVVADDSAFMNADAATLDALLASSSEATGADATAGKKTKRRKA